MPIVEHHLIWISGTVITSVLWFQIWDGRDYRGHNHNAINHEHSSRENRSIQTLTDTEKVLRERERTFRVSFRI